jgi:two-component system probable response regulator PhcQ
MDELYDYKRFAVLYVDDEEKSLKYFSRIFESQFRILTAANAQEGFRTLEKNRDDIGLIITDQRMPGEQGVQLLAKARQLRPRVIRVLATAFADITAAIEAVNSGAIYKYVTKPWDVPQLEATLKRGLEFFMLQRERDQLLHEKLSVLHNMLIADRMVSLGVLAAGLGHHVRNSLVAVRTFLDLAPSKLAEEKVDLHELQNPNFWKEFYDHVQLQIRRITEMLTDLGAASEKASAGFHDTLQVDSVIAQILEGASKNLVQKSIEVQTVFAPDLPPLTVDKWKFHRLFELLLHDEISNLPEGGRISIKACRLPGDQGSAGEVQVEVSDNGPGLPEEALRSIFDPFFLRNDNPQEFGVNLMTCYFLVYHHGGRIDVRSRPGQGTTFTLTFPVAPQARSFQQEEKEILRKALWNDQLWERLLSGG